jgi:hypothetical protein
MDDNNRGFLLRSFTFSNLARLLAGALLLASITFSVQPSGQVSAATCTSTADGDWANSSIWSCGHVPIGLNDNAVIASAVTIFQKTDVNSVTITTGHSLTVNGFNVLVVSGDFDVQSGATFDPGSGTVDFHYSSDQRILTHGATVNFFDLVKTANFWSAVLIDASPSSAIHVQHYLGGRNAIYNGPPDSSGYLKLFSTSPGTQWRLAAQSGLVVDFVTVQDSNNQGTQISPAHGVYHGTGTGNNTHWTLSAPVATRVLIYSFNYPGHPNQPVTFRTNTYALTGSLQPTGNMAFYSQVLGSWVPVTNCESIPATPYLLPPPYPLPAPPSPLPANTPYSETPCQITFTDLGTQTIRATFTGTGIFADATPQDMAEPIMIPYYLPLISR